MYFKFWRYLSLKNTKYSWQLLASISCCLHQLLHQQISCFTTFWNIIQHFHGFSFFNGFTQPPSWPPPLPPQPRNCQNPLNVTIFFLSMFFYQRFYQDVFMKFLTAQLHWKLFVIVNFLFRFKHFRDLASSTSLRFSEELKILKN